MRIRSRSRLLALAALAAAGAFSPACSHTEGPSSDPAGSTTSSGRFEPVDLDRALERAREGDRIVMIDFWATWCQPCKILDKKTLSDPQVSAWLGEHAVSIKVDIDENQALAKRFRIRGVPCLVFLDSEGEELLRLTGVYPPEEVLEAFLRLESQ